MTSAAMPDVPYLDLANPSFSIRSQAVRDARASGWYARTSYGIAVLRYEEVGALLRDPRLRQGSYKWPALNDATGRFADWWGRMLLNRVGADHARLRRLASPAFSPKLIAGLQPRFEAIANELIDAVAAAGRCEFMAAFSEPYATRVICELIELPEARWRQLADIAAGMGLALGVTYKQDLATVNAATDRMFDFAGELVEDRRRNGLGADFISTLIRANENKEALSDDELHDMIVLSIFGGIDTTRNQIGLALSMFIDSPEQWRLLGARPELARNAVEEVMRTRPTTTWVTREALEDFTFKDLAIERGTTLHLFAESAGTDPEHFAAGFDITVKRKQHYGFGGGTHHCLGHFIAKGDMSVALKILARRLPNVAYDGPARWLPDSGNTGPITLPVKFDAGH